MRNRLIILAMLAGSPVWAYESPLLKPKPHDCVSVEHHPSADVAAENLNSQGDVLPPGYADQVNLHLNLPAGEYLDKPKAYNAPVNELILETGTLSIDTRRADPCAPEPIK